MKSKTLTPRKRRHARVRAKIFGTAERPRLSLFRSRKHVWAHIIDDQKGATLTAASDVEKEGSSGGRKSSVKTDTVLTGESRVEVQENMKGFLGDEGAKRPRRADEQATEAGKKTERAARVGKALAEKAISLGVKEVVFDRGGYKYHGRVKALAEGARAGGLKF